MTGMKPPDPMKGDGGQPVKLRINHNRKCAHCNTIHGAGTTIVCHCKHCGWWSCPGCGARNSRYGHTHNDHARNVCPAKGAK